MGDSRLSPHEALDGTGIQLRLTDMGAGRQEAIHHELRPGSGREETLIESSEAIECRSK